MPSSSSRKPVVGLQLITGYLGVVAMLSGSIVMLPLLVIPVYPQDAVWAVCFILPGIVSLMVGYLMYFICIRDRVKGRLRKNEDAVIIIFTWFIAIMVCAAPFVLCGDYTFSQAVFETTSGLTTTGLSIVDVTVCPHIFLMHRSVLLFFGGVGLVLIMVSAVSDSHGLRIYNAEGHTDKLLPNMAKSARLILGLYVGYILAGTLMYQLAGMPAFDALNTSISAISTGGFVVNPDSIGGYHSLAIEAISVVLMLLGATNFLLHFLFLRGDFKAYFGHAETKAFYLVIGSFSIACALILCACGLSGSLPDALRVAIFQVVSVITTTGFQTIPSFSVLPSGVLFLFVLLMLMGSEAGSTAGGIKMFRVVVAVKSMYWMLRDRFSHRRNVHSNKINRFGELKECTLAEQRDVTMFIGLYLCLFMVGSFIFTLFGYSLENSLFEFASSLGNVGVSIGVVTADANPVILWTASVGMFFGRLEIYPVFLGLWRFAADVKGKLVKGIGNA